MRRMNARSWFVRTSPAVSHRMLRLNICKKKKEKQTSTCDATPLFTSPHLTKCGTAD